MSDGKPGTVPDCRAGMNIILFAVVVFVYWLLFAEAFAWVQPEYFLRWLPNSLVNGFDLEWRDLGQALNAKGLDGAARPRFLSYLLSAITAKLRIMGYDYFVPPPYLSPAFVISIIASPILFYKFSLNFFRDRATAVTSTLLYLASVGFISSTSFLYHPGKSLVNVTALLLLWALSIINLASRPFGHPINRQVLAVMILNMIGIAIDETYFVISLCAVLLFPRLFFSGFHRGSPLFLAVRPLVLYFSPYLAFLAFIAVAAPLIGPKVGVTAGGYFGYLYDVIQAYYLSPSASATTGSLWNISAISLYQVIERALVPAYLFSLSHAEPFLRLCYWGGLVAIVVTATFILYRRTVQASSVAAGDGQSQERVFIPLAVSFIAFVFVSTVVQRLHSGAISGYYYGSMVSIFISLIIAFLFAGPHVRRYIPLHALVIVFAVCSVSNAYESTIAYDYNHAAYIAQVHNGGVNHTYPFMTKERFPKVQLDAVKNRGPFHDNHGQRAEMERIRQLWRNGTPVDLNELGHWPAQDTWFLAEMFYVYERSKKAP